MTGTTPSASLSRRQPPWRSRFGWRSACCWAASTPQLSRSSRKPTGCSRPAMTSCATMMSCWCRSERRSGPPCVPAGKPTATATGSCTMRGAPVPTVHPPPSAAASRAIRSWAGPGTLRRSRDAADAIASAQRVLLAAIEDALGPGSVRAAERLLAADAARARPLSRHSQNTAPAIAKRTRTAPPGRIMPSVGTNRANQDLDWRYGMKCRAA